jgi:hypothetical protein
MFRDFAYLMALFRERLSYLMPAKRFLLESEAS